MKKSVDKTSKTDIIGLVEEPSMINFQALRETVLTERQAKINADAKLAADLAATNKPAATFTGTTAVDELFDWIDG